MSSLSDAAAKTKPKASAPVYSDATEAEARRKRLADIASSISGNAPNGAMLNPSPIQDSTGEMDRLLGEAKYTLAKTATPPGGSSAMSALKRVPGEAADLAAATEQEHLARPQRLIDTVQGMGDVIGTGASFIPALAPAATAYFGLEGGKNLAMNGLKGIAEHPVQSALDAAMVGLGAHNYLKTPAYAGATRPWITGTGKAETIGSFGGGKAAHLAEDIPQSIHDLSMEPPPLGHLNPLRSSSYPRPPAYEDALLDSPKRSSVSALRPARQHPNEAMGADKLDQILNDLHGADRPSVGNGLYKGGSMAELMGPKPGYADRVGLEAPLDTLDEADKRKIMSGGAGEGPKPGRQFPRSKVVRAKK